jgi:hypothetical protein
MMKGAVFNWSVGGVIPSEQRGRVDVIREAPSAQPKRR